MPWLTTAMRQERCCAPPSRALRWPEPTSSLRQIQGTAHKAGNPDTFTDFSTSTTPMEKNMLYKQVDTAVIDGESLPWVPLVPYADNILLKYFKLDPIRG